MEQKLLQIIQRYGVNHQIRKFNEEALELEEAIITHELKKSVEYEIPLTEIIGTKEHITEELADTMVLLEQFKLYYGITSEEITKIFWSKVDRQLDRIDKEVKDE